MHPTSLLHSIRTICMKTTTRLRASLAYPRVIDSFWLETFLMFGTMLHLSACDLMLRSVFNLTEMRYSEST
jgi:hypothetical protein